MFYDQEEIKITQKKEDNSSNYIKNIIYFSYNGVDYMYYKTKIKEYKHYVINLYFER